MSKTNKLVSTFQDGGTFYFRHLDTDTNVKWLAPFKVSDYDTKVAMLARQAFLRWCEQHNYIVEWADGRK